MAARQPKKPPMRIATSAEQEAADFIRDRGDDQFALKGIGTDRDMTDVERLKAVRLSRLNYKRSGIYGQLVDTLVNFVVGDGLAFKPKDDDVEEWLTEVFDAPINDFHGSIRSRYSNCIIDGEYLLAITVPLRASVKGGDPLSMSAKPMLGRMDCDSICEIEVAAVNQDKVLAVWVEPGGGKPKVRYPIARPGVEPRDNGDGTATAVLLWRVNTLKRRGLPFFSRTLDKAHMLDGVVDELARKAKYTSRFWLHATYTDQGTPKANKAAEKKLLNWMNSWTPGASLASTGGVEVKVFNPDLNLVDQKALYDLVVDYVLGSHGIPRHWFSSGDGTNRATSVEQGTPIFRAVDAAQSQFANDIRELVAYLVWLGKETGAIGADCDEEVSIIPTDVATRDSIRDTKEVNDLMAALDLAVANGVLSPLERQKIGRRVFSSKGWEEELDQENPPPLPGAEGQPGIGPEGLPGHRNGDGEDGDTGQRTTVPTGGEATGHGAPPAGGSPGVPGADVQGTAMNGAQVTALQLIVQAVADETLPATAARAMVMAAFPFIPAELVDDMIDAADEFTPKPKEPIAPPPGTAPKPGEDPKPVKPPTKTMKES